MNKKTYQERKEEVRQEAINYQLRLSTENFCLNSIWHYQEYFTRVGKRYGLIKEFRENGII